MAKTTYTLLLKPGPYPGSSSVQVQRLLAPLLGGVRLAGQQLRPRLPIELTREEYLAHDTLIARLVLGGALEVTEPDATPLTPEEAASVVAQDEQAGATMQAAQETAEAAATAPVAPEAPALEAPEAPSAAEVAVPEVAPEAAPAPAPAPRKSRK